MGMGIRMDYGSPRWSGEITDCSLPVTLDTYNNCAFGCLYCFSQYRRGVGNTRDDYWEKNVSAINVERVKKIFSGEDTTNQFAAYIKDRRPIQYGGLSDQFDGFERKYGVTYELLKYLRQIDYPICFSTKSTWVFFDEKYRELFRGADNWNMKFSIITLDETDAKKIEIGVSTPQRRLEAMREYTKLSNGGVTLRLRPFIIGVSDKTYLDLIRAAHDAGATAVSTEFFCLETRSIKIAAEHYKKISEVCGYDIVDFYRSHSKASSGYLRLNRKIKEPYIRAMQQLCVELGMRFYVSDAHFKECSDNCCCCGLNPNWNYSRGNFSAALQIAKKTGTVRWSDIEPDMYFLDTFPWRYAEGFNTTSCECRAMFDGMTMKGYLRYLWNNPARGQSPYRMFSGILVPDGYDSNGDVIYKYNANASFQPITNEKYNLEEL